MENEKFLSSVISVFKRYLPKRVIEKIMANPSKIKVEGEKRFATVLFGDLSGFTALTEKLYLEPLLPIQMTLKGHAVPLWR